MADTAQSVRSMVGTAAVTPTMPRKDWREPTAAVATLHEETAVAITEGNFRFSDKCSGDVGGESRCRDVFLNVVSPTDEAEVAELAERRDGGVEPCDRDRSVGRSRQGIKDCFRLWPDCPLQSCYWTPFPILICSASQKHFMKSM